MNKRSTKYSIFLFLAIFLFSLPYYAYSVKDNTSINIDEKKLYELPQVWLSRADDNPENRKFTIDLKLWSYSNIAMSWSQLEGYGEYDGNSWHRINLRINENIKELSLFIPVHGRDAQYYFNEQVVHETGRFALKGKTEAISWRPGIFSIPARLIQPGNNLLCVRTGPPEGRGLGSDKFYIGPNTVIEQKWISYILWSAIPAAGYIFLALYFFFYFLVRKSDIFSLYYSGLALSLGMVILGYKGLILWFLDFKFMYLGLTYAGLLLFPPFLLLFLKSFLHFPDNRIPGIIAAIYFMVTVSVFGEFIVTGGIYYFLRYTYEPCLISLVPVSFYGVYICSMAVKVKKPFAYAMLAGVLLVSVTLIISAVSIAGLIQFEPPVAEAFSSAVIIYAIALAYRTARVHIDLEKSHEMLLSQNRMKDDIPAAASKVLETRLQGIEGIADVIISGGRGIMAAGKIPDMYAWDNGNESKKASVLVVDDDPVNQRVIENQLRQAGYSVMSVPSGPMALEYLEKSKVPDIILLDVMMPGMSGYEACGIIRSRFSLHELPIIMVTARNQIPDLVTAFEYGANDYLSKPFDKRELLSRVNTLVTLRRTVKKYEESSYRILQDRTNPHFLFNAINTIHSFLSKDRDTEKADKAILMLADILRYLMDMSFHALVPFEKEWEFINNYLKFECLRFPETVRFHIEKTGDFSDVVIPPLTIQPIAENSIKHGIRNKPGGGKVSIKAVNDGTFVRIMIEDDGSGLQKEDIFSRTLGNIRNMLKYHFKISDVSVNNRAEGGVLAEIFFALEKRG